MNAIMPITLMPAPTGIQPGGYVSKAYVDRSTALTPTAELSVNRSKGVIILRWKCSEPIRDASDNPSQFIDSAAVLSPEVKDAPWVLMGAPGAALSGVLWRADRNPIYNIRSEGLGSVKRSDPPENWKGNAQWEDGYWILELTLPNWRALDETKQIAVAIWQGSESERGGLKSVSTGWVTVP